MTPRQENEIAILVGRLAAQVEGVINTLESLNAKADAAVEWRHEVKDRLEKMERHGITMTAVAGAFEALQKSIHEGGIKAQAYSRGFMIGIGFAAGGVGAGIATGLEWVLTKLSGGA